ncbi:MAG: radical SAM protein [Clostridia bacterium]|nr:radical SAM protein [Clostridia bacterium]
MNEYLRNLSKIEFVITYACTGKCKHCSEGTHSGIGDHISADVASEAVRKTAQIYPIQTVMTFGGEPLLYSDVVFEIMSCAKELNIPKRQVITNGFFSKAPSDIKRIAQGLYTSGVNDLRISVDAFHQETIPLDIVKLFAKEARICGIPIQLQPAWLVSKEHENPYNEKTRKILSEFEAMGLSQGSGNIVFPQGNALEYLSEYLAVTHVENPYVEDPYNIKCISFSPNGDVLNGNAYKQDITDILRTYSPVG